MSITYHPETNRKIIGVKLDEVKIGEIRASTAGFRYYPEGSGKPDDAFHTLAECQRSLEAKLTDAAPAGIDETGSDEHTHLSVDYAGNGQIVVTGVLGPVAYLAPDLPDGYAEAIAPCLAASTRMLKALKRQVENVERWLETGEPASAEESRSIYEQMVKAIAAAKGL